MSQTKCIHCDGLGYFYNQATFQSEHCPHCEGKGVIEVSIAEPENPIGINTTTSVHNEVPVVEAPKPKKTTKAPVVETPVVEAEPASVEEPIVETPTSGSDAK